MTQNPGEKRTFAKYSLFFPICWSSAANKADCSWTSLSTLSTCSLVNWGGGSENVTEPEAEIWALTSFDSICEKEVIPIRRAETRGLPTILSSKALTSSSDSTLMALPMSERWSVTYVAVSFFNAHPEARLMACWIKPRFFSYIHRVN